MSRKGCPNKVHSGIYYPRKCEYCGYISNNPSMYHYHKKTHSPIPEGTLCWKGCGNPATVLNTRGRYTCLPKVQQCPEYIKQHSIRVSKTWEGDIARKEKTKEIFFKYCCGVPDVMEKQKTTLKKKFGDFTPEQMKDYRHYARRIRSRAQKWAKEQGHTLGQQTYHVDHKLSVLDAWKAGLSEEIVNHPANLQILEAKINSSKGSKSSITVNELFELISKY